LTRSSVAIPREGVAAARAPKEEKTPAGLLPPKKKERKKSAVSLRPGDKMTAGPKKKRTGCRCWGERGGGRTAEGEKEAGPSGLQGGKKKKGVRNPKKESAADRTAGRGPGEKRERARPRLSGEERKKGKCTIAARARPTEGGKGEKKKREP